MDLVSCDICFDKQKRFGTCLDCKNFTICTTCAPTYFCKKAECPHCRSKTGFMNQQQVEQLHTMCRVILLLEESGFI